MMRILFISCFLATIISCQNKTVKDFSETEFFNIYAYSQDFCKKHQKAPTLIQILQADGQKQELEKDSSSLEFIRTMCKKANIDNPTLYDKYKVKDTIIDGKEITIYQSLDDNLLVKELTITKVNSSIENVIMNTSYGNLMSQTNKVIEFYNTGKIQMETHTKSKLSEDIDMDVVWTLQ